MTATTWGEGFLEHINDAHRRGQIDIHQTRRLRAIAEFCTERNAGIPTDDAEVNLYGLGVIRPAYINVNRPGYWIYLGDLVEPSGVPFERLAEEWRRERDEGEDVDLIVFLDRDGELIGLPVMNDAAVLRVLTGPSPWANEILKNLTGAFRRAAVASRIAAQFQPTFEQPDGTYAQSGQTLEEYLLAEGLPTAEEAREQAMRGPVIDGGDA